MSIESQEAELERAFRGRPDIDIVATYKEAYSAKAPGRPVFDEMLRRVERGDAEGVIAWHPDRLARNSVDGGRVIYLLDRKVLSDLKFPNFTFENNPQGKFMLSIIFGYSKYYVDNLSENVKRGNRAKLAQGWRPNYAPLGYLNDRQTKTIVPDAEYLPIVRRLFDLMLQGCYSTRDVARIARDHWGFLTPKRRRIGGTPLSVSTVHKILTNPFYAGIIRWDGREYEGKHEPIVTLNEYERIREMLSSKGRPRPKAQLYFAYSGLITCGSCGLRLTAEAKVNRYGSRYTYYHCAKRALGPRCTEPSIEVTSLEEQLLACLARIIIPCAIHKQIVHTVTESTPREEQGALQRKDAIHRAISESESQLRNLTSLRIRDLVQDEEYLAQRNVIQRQLLQLRQQLAAPPRAAIEPAQLLISFSNRAIFWFRRGNERIKRLIVQTATSNLSVTAKILRFEAAKPFVALSNSTACPNQLGLLDNIRTFLDDPDFKKRLEYIKELHELMGEPLPWEKRNRRRKMEKSRAHFAPRAKGERAPDTESPAPGT